ncbi:MAG: HpsJ family protein [Prochlorotrichaceae cyanobacterium]|jgi:hypothetical protein
MVQIPSNNRLISSLRVLGYAFFMLLLLDYGFLLISAQFTNPNWEYQTIGRLTETVWLPILTLALIFIPDIHPEQEDNLRFWFAIHSFSWMSLFLALLYLMMTPLLIMDGLRIDRINQAQLTQGQLQQETVFQRFNEGIQNLDSLEIENILSAYQAQGNAPNIQTSEEFKSLLLSQAKTQVEQNTLEQQSRFKTQRKNLIKQTVKWGLGNLISAITFFYIWDLSKKVIVRWKAKIKTLESSATTTQDV